MIFRLKNIYICISWYFWIMLGFILVSGRIQIFLSCLIALLLHELGHIVAIYFFNEKISIFYILPFGFCCRLKNQNKISNKNMIKILLAGPVTSIIVAGFFIFWTTKIAIVSFVIGVFNFLPFWDLDGGRLREMLSKM